MSYILDALKKSEEQRNGEDLPEWNQEEVAASPVAAKQTSRIMVGSLLLLTPVLLGLVYWVFFSATDDAESNLAAESGMVDIEILSENEPIINAFNDPKKSIKKISLREFNKAQGIEEKPKAPLVHFSKQPLDGMSQEQSDSKTSSKSKRKSNNVAVSVFELPESMQRSLPALLFSGHVYSSENSKRHIMINSQKLKEGDVAALGIILNKITLSGAEFTYKGRRFNLNALQDWEGLE